MPAQTRSHPVVIVGKLLRFPSSAAWTVYMPPTAEPVTAIPVTAPPEQGQAVAYDAEPSRARVRGTQREVVRIGHAQHTVPGRRNDATAHRRAALQLSREVDAADQRSGVGLLPATPRS